MKRSGEVRFNGKPFTKAPNNQRKYTSMEEMIFNPPKASSAKSILCGISSKSLVNSECILLF
jgi:hypothetical protein